MREITFVFFSTLDENQFKGTRLNGYIELLNKLSIRVNFVGLPTKDKQINLNNPNLFVTNCRIGLRVYLLLFKIFNPIGFGTFARYASIFFITIRAKRKLHQNHVLVTQPYFYSLIKFAKKKSIKVLIECDTDYPELNWKLLKKRNKVNKIKFWDRDPWNFYPYVKNASRSLHLADAILIFSEYAKNTLIAAGITKERIYLASPPADKKYFEIENQRFRDPEFFWVGNHGLRKGIDLLAPAWLKYKNGGGRGHLHICGEISPSQRKFRQHLKTLSDVKDHDKVNMYDFLRSSKKILLSPSISEGLPRVVVETMSAGSPVIATRAGGAELVKHNESGWVIEHDEGSLYEAIVAADSNWNEVSRMGEKARRDIIERTSSFYETVIRLILSN